MEKTACKQGPRRCGADRRNGWGRCGADDSIRIARIAPHYWEEPPISGTKGTGAVFFCGCPLHCVFCQNREISGGGAIGRIFSEEALAQAILGLQVKGCHSIDLVTAGQYAQKLAPLLRALRPQLKIPIVWNSSGYETPETLLLLQGLVDVYLPDFKYYDSALSERMCAAPDYFEVASAALFEMVRQSGPCVFGADGILRRGTLVRHLVLPGHRRDSIALMEYLGAHFSPSQIRVSLMWQYTPPAQPIAGAPELSRRVTRFEYESAAQALKQFGFDGYVPRLFCSRGESSASTPPASKKHPMAMRAALCGMRAPSSAPSSDAGTPRIQSSKSRRQDSVCFLICTGKAPSTAQR